MFSCKRVPQKIRPHNLSASSTMHLGACGVKRRRRPEQPWRLKTRRPLWRSSCESLRRRIQRKWILHQNIHSVPCAPDEGAAFLRTPTSSGTQQRYHVELSTPGACNVEGDVTGWLVKVKKMIFKLPVMHVTVQIYRMLLDENNSFAPGGCHQKWRPASCRSAHNYEITHYISW